VLGSLRGLFLLIILEKQKKKVRKFKEVKKSRELNLRVMFQVSCFMIHDFGFDQVVKLRQTSFLSRLCRDQPKFYYLVDF